MAETIVRIAARGDGVSESGRHVPFAVPGDQLLDDGTLVHGPDHQNPPCRHFPECGGCQLQHASDPAYCAYLRERIANALAQHGLSTDIREPHLSPPNSRRRASLKALMVGERAVIGFHAERSHRIVDMRECHILRPELFALVESLRTLFTKLLKRKAGAEAGMTIVDQGVDLAIKGIEAEGLEAIERLTAFSDQHRLARLSLDRSLGPEVHYEPQPATVTLSGVPVIFPVDAFLQATADGEAALVEAVREATAGSSRIADLFAGLGTFALAVGGSVHAAEASRDAVLALKSAAPSMKVEHRDLYRRPLDEDELAAFDALVLDPPRAGAAHQVELLARSKVPRIAYVSCNPATFARDAAVLVSGGYALQWVRPVGQFRWSTHVELVAAFAR